MIILGDSNVGKTTLIYRYIGGTFITNLKNSIGTMLFSKSLEINSEKINIQIWDFAGEDKFRFLLKNYTVGANGALLLYDITNQGSFSHLEDWLEEIRANTGDIPILLIGSKLDLANNRQVSNHKGRDAAREMGIESYIELSSKTGENVEHTFQVLTEFLVGIPET